MDLVDLIAKLKQSLGDDPQSKLYAAMEAWNPAPNPQTMPAYRDTQYATPDRSNPRNTLPSDLERYLQEVTQRQQVAEQEMRNQASPRVDIYNDTTKGTPTETYGPTYPRGGAYAFYGDPPAFSVMDRQLVSDALRSGYFPAKEDTRQFGELTGLIELLLQKGPDALGPAYAGAPRQDPSSSYFVAPTGTVMHSGNRQQMPSIDMLLRLIQGY